MNNKRQAILIFLVLGLFCGAPVRSQRLGNEERVTFAPNKVSPGVTWSSTFSLNGSGLETATPGYNGFGVWLHSHPFPVSRSWQTTRGVMLRVHYDGNLDETTPEAGAYPRVFVRYSTDKRHWSHWHPIARSNKRTAAGEGIYEGNLSLPPRDDFAEFNSVKLEWWETRPGSGGMDQHEFCEWIARNHPGYFAGEIPLLGYIRVRLEKGWVSSKLSLKSLTIEYQPFEISGFGGEPADQPKARKNAYDKWFFVGPPVDGKKL